MNIANVFTCSRCGGHRIEEVVTSHVSRYPIESFDEITGFRYGTVIDSDGGVRYQCADCSHLVAENYKALFEALKEAFNRSRT